MHLLQTFLVPFHNIQPTKCTVFLHRYCHVTLNIPTYFNAQVNIIRETIWKNNSVLCSAIWYSFSDDDPLWTETCRHTQCDIVIKHINKHLVHFFCFVSRASRNNRVKRKRKTNLMSNLFLVYFFSLYMFRAYLGPSSGGTTVFIQQLVCIIIFRWMSVVLVV